MQEEEQRAEAVKPNGYLIGLVIAAELEDAPGLHAISLQPYELRVLQAKRTNRLRKLGTS